MAGNDQDQLDAIVRHRVGIERLSESVVRKIVKHLEDVHEDIEVQLAKDLNRVTDRGVYVGVRAQERLKRLREVIRGLLAEAHIALRKDLASEAYNLAKYEVEWVERFYRDLGGFAAQFEKPSADMLRAIVTSRPFQGAVLKDWASKMEKAQLDRIWRGIQIGITEGESTPEIVNRLKGTRALKLRDGQFAKDKRGAEALVRTTITHVQARAHEGFAVANRKLFPQYEWISTLDSRTTKLCIARSGQIYTTGEGPLPPAHWNCRSTIRYISRFEDVMPIRPTYQDWLKGQPKSVQDEVLGPRRGDMFRKGTIRATDLVDQKGRALTLDELRAREGL